MKKQHKDTIISHLEINAMALKSQLYDVTKTLEYIYENSLLKQHGSGILHQTLGKHIVTSNSLLSKNY